MADGVEVMVTARLTDDGGLAVDYECGGVTIAMEVSSLQADWADMWSLLTNMTACTQQALDEARRQVRAMAGASLDAADLPRVLDQAAAAQREMRGDHA